MALCKDQMAALIVTKNSKSWRDKPKPVRNVLGETLSAYFANAIGVKNAKKGWRSKPFMFFGKRRVGTHTVGRLSRADLEAGWNGGLSTAEAKETTRHRPHAFFQRSDVPSFGKGPICTWWTMERHDWICSVRDRDSFPEWYTAHQP